MSEPKEPFFFEAEYELGVAYYWYRYFSHWKGQRLVGDARHRNLFLPYVARRIEATVPGARFIVILRDPVSRAMSHWWHWFRFGREELYFDEAIETDFERISAGEDFSTPEQIAYYQAHLGADGRGPYRTYVDTGHYAIQLERYFELFPRDRFRILIMEEVVKNPRAHCAALFEFLQVDPAEADRLNYDQLNRADLMFKRFAARWTSRRMHALLRGGAPHGGPPVMARAPKMSPETRARLRKHFAPHNKRLAELLGRPLPWSNE